MSVEPTPDTGAASVDLAVSRRPGVEARNGKFGGPSLIPDLEEIKARHGYLPREELVALAHRARRPLYEIQGLISFYPHFRTDPPVKVDLHVCHDLACWMAGYEGRLAELRDRYGSDVDVEIREVSCLGRCDAAPAVWVNEHTARVDDAETLVEQARDDALPVLRYPRAQHEWPNDPYVGGARDYAVARRLLDGVIDPDAAIATLKDAGLRGMGGAGFPTGLKWGVVRAEVGAEKYAICNADESEPGTFKDSQILADQPHLVLEGLLIGMLVVGADRGYVYIRHEYVPEADALRAEIERMQAIGLLHATRTIEIFVSPGGYILGEETALLEAMEGHRGEPRNKPPFPGQHGLWGCPTLINSVETLADVPIILERGAEWWTAQGVNGSTGLKFFAVSGDVEEPAVYCVPMGTTVGELISLAGGVSGDAPSAPCNPEAHPPTSSARRSSTRHWTSRRLATPGRCSARALSSSARREPTCLPPRRTYCASSVTRAAANACPVASARRRRTRSWPIISLSGALLATSRRESSSLRKRCA